MQIEQLTRLLMNDDEVAATTSRALWMICAGVAGTSLLGITRHDNA